MKKSEWNKHYDSLFYDNPIVFQIKTEFDFLEYYAFITLLKQFMGKFLQFSLYNSNNNRFIRYYIEDLRKMKFCKEVDENILNIIYRFVNIQFEIPFKKRNVIRIFINKIKPTMNDNDSLNINTFKKAYEKYYQYIRRLLKESLEDIIKRVNHVQIVQGQFWCNYVFNGRYIKGVYDAGRIKLAQGYTNGSFSMYSPQLVKVLARHDKIRINDLNNNIKEIDFELYFISRIYTRLLSVIFRAYVSDSIFESFAGDKVFEQLNNKIIQSFDNSIFKDKEEGQKVKINREKLLKGNKFYDYWYKEYFPEDTQDLIERFFKLDFEVRQEYLNCCNSYWYAMKFFYSKDYANAIAKLVAVIENLATIEYKTSKGDDSCLSKTKNIVNDLFEVDDELNKVIDSYYILRSRNVHRGESEKLMNDYLFDTCTYDDQSFANLETIVHFCLIKWLIKKTN